MATPTSPTKTELLIRRLDEAVESIAQGHCCYQVKEVLESICDGEEDFIDASFQRPTPGKYARRLLHRDPAGRYTVLVMVWDKGQGTPIHDHSGMWCVECVYRGRIKVVPYDLVGNEDDPVVDFKPQQQILAGVGEAGALIPPFDYHTIENVESEPAVTIHVYGGEMTSCHVFVPIEGGGYRKEARQLCYSED